MSFIVAALWALFFTVVAELLRPKQSPGGSTASALSDLKLPTAEEGRTIAVVFGTCRVEAPNVTWYGNLVSQAIKKKVRTGLFSKKSITAGYKYYLSMQMMVCWGVVDEIVNIFFDKKVPAGTRTEATDTTLFTYNDAGLFGGDEKEGGISGIVRAYKGTTTQTANAYLQGLIGKPISAYRRITHLAFENTYLGTSGYIKPVAVVVRRCPNPIGLTGSKHNISGDANPACMIYEAMTDQFWGARVSTGLFDIASFVDAGETLYDESIGLSMQVNGGMTVEDFVTTVLEHVDGALYSDLSTGLITLKLAREDYTLESLLVLDESNSHSLKLTRPSWSETKNTVRVKYFDRAALFEPRTVQYQDQANIAARGGLVVASDKNLDAYSRSAPALWAASRLGKANAYPLARIELVANREASVLRPGGVFRLQYTLAEEEIDAVFRIGEIKYGTLMDSEIKIVAAEDIFAVPFNAYDPPPGSDFEPPVTTPVPATRRYAYEAPFYELQQSLESNEVAAALPPGYGYFAVAASRPSSLTQDGLVYLSVSGGPYTFETSIDFMPSAFLDAAMTKLTDASIPFVNGVDMERVAINDYAIIGNEAVRITSINLGLGTINVVRGCLDTVVTEHSSGVPIYVVADNGGADDNAYPNGTTANVKIATTTEVATLDLSLATADSLTITDRYSRPYPPGWLTINGVPYSATLSGTAITAAWQHRNRLTNALSGEGTAFTPEAGTTYNIRLYNHLTSALIEQFTGITGNSQTFSAIAAGSYQLRLELESVRGGLVSRQKHVHLFDYSI